MRRRTASEKVYDRQYNEQRHRRQREEVVRLLGSQCTFCGAFKHAEFLEVVPREGERFRVPSGGRYLHSMRLLRREILPKAVLVCAGGCGPGGPAT